MGGRFITSAALAVSLAASAQPDVRPAATQITIVEAVARALRQNPAVGSAQRKLEAAGARLQAARAMAGLQVATGLIAGAASRERMTGVGATEPAVMAMLGRDAAVAHEATAMLPLDTGGKLQADIRRAEAQAGAAAADLEAVRAEIAARVRMAFLRALLASERIQVAEADQRAAALMADNARAALDAGKTIEATYLRAQARVRESEGAVAQAQAERSEAVIAVAEAMGSDPGEDLQPSGALDIEPTYPDRNAALQAIRERSPEVQAALHRRDAASAESLVFRGEERPQIIAFAMGGWEASRGMTGRGGASVGVSVGLPLFDGGLRRQRRRASEALVGAMEEEVREATLAAEAEVHSAWVAMEAAAARLRAAEAGLEAAEAAHAVLALRVANQKSILVEELDALAAVQSARLAVAGAKFDRSIAAVRVDRAVGRR